MTRPKRSEKDLQLSVLSVRLTAEDREALLALAARTSHSPSETIRRLIREAHERGECGKHTEELMQELLTSIEKLTKRLAMKEKGR